MIENLSKTTYFTAFLYSGARAWREMKTHRSMQNLCFRTHVLMCAPVLIHHGTLHVSDRPGARQARAYKSIARTPYHAESQLFAINLCAHTCEKNSKTQQKQLQARTRRAPTKALRAPRTMQNHSYLLSTLVRTHVKNAAKHCKKNHRRAVQVNE